MIGQPVRTEIFYREDIRNVLEAMLSAVVVAPPMYRLGFISAIRAVAIAYDVQIIGLEDEREKLIKWAYTPEVGDE